MARIPRREADETSSGISEYLELKARIKSDFQKHYEPRAVSIGPILHGDKKYELGEKHKLMMTNEFVNGSA
ncbi:hypothetical protein CFP56_032464 [Quercus suber]|uniref:Uncharacterized protein n=1 Tax=Quercus suber TaxID=58331 RepID=A0AAW0JGV1_QUESU